MLTVIGDRERCSQAGMVRILPYLDENVADDHSSFVYRTITLPVRYSWLYVDSLTDVNLLEPLRRGDLLNAVNKLAGERGAAKHHHLLRRSPAIAQLPAF